MKAIAKILFAKTKDNISLVKYIMQLLVANAIVKLLFAKAIASLQGNGHNEDSYLAKPIPKILSVREPW